MRSSSSSSSGFASLTISGEGVAFSVASVTSSDSLIGSSDPVAVLGVRLLSSRECSCLSEFWMCSVNLASCKTSFT